MKVLVADDSIGWRNYHEKLLSAMGLDVTVADWARDAYSLAFQTPYDLVVTDLQMEDDFAPQYAGEWLVERIKELKGYLNVPILIVSASYNIEQIADNYGVHCMAKAVAANNPTAYGYKISELLKLD